MKGSTATRELATIDAEIAETKAALKNVRGSETEVYARIVGYYRAVRNWNKGKKDEFNHRKMFTLDASTKYSVTGTASGCSIMKKTDKPAQSKSTEVPASTGEINSYEFYARQTCPNCPPIKNYMTKTGMSGTVIDVDTKDGLSKAALKGVFAAPTVIFYDTKGVELARGHNVDELNAILAPVTIAEAV